MDPAQRRATYEDLLQVPDRFIAEIIDGELLTSPRPASPHSYAASSIMQDVGPFSRSLGGSDGRGGWWILFEPELHFGTDVLVPDLAAWRRDRMPILENVAYFEQAPDWVCEVISPSTGRTDRVRKMPIYAHEQVAHIWLVDPLQRTLEVYRLEEQGWFLVSSYGDSGSVHAEPFEALEIDINRWWLEQRT
jgi:Uma2 family endonuclease